MNYILAMQPIVPPHRKRDRDAQGIRDVVLPVGEIEDERRGRDAPVDVVPQHFKCCQRRTNHQQPVQAQHRALLEEPPLHERLQEELVRVRGVEAEPVRAEPPALDPRWRARETRGNVQAMQERIFVKHVLVLLDPIHHVDEEPGVAVARIVRGERVHGKRRAVQPRRRLEAENDEGQPPARRASPRRAAASPLLLPPLVLSSPPLSVPLSRSRARLEQSRMKASSSLSEDSSESYRIVSFVILPVKRFS